MLKSNLFLIILLSALVATTAEARGPLKRHWLMYPSRAMDACRGGSAPSSYAHRCDDLLGAYGRELEACVAGRRGGPVLGERQIVLQQSAPACAATAAKMAAEAVK